MTQNALDYSQNPSGVELMDTFLAGMAENQLTNHSGVSRPSYAQAGTFWIDTSVIPWVLKQFTGTSDVRVGTLDQTNLYFTATRALGDKNGNDITTTYLTTTGTAAKATADADGNIISSTYLTTTGTAAKATADANGDTITSTYAKLAGTNTFSDKNTFSDEIISTNGNAIRFVGNGYGKIFHQSSAGFYLLLTNQNDEYGSYNSLRPFSVNLSNGVVTTMPNSATHGVVTTEAISKNSNGYVKLGNGVIIQWGRFSISSYNQTGTITFPTAFSNTNYSLAFGSFRNGQTGIGQGYFLVTNNTSSNFTYKLVSGSDNYASQGRWIAIGY